MKIHELVENVEYRANNKNKYKLIGGVLHYFNPIYLEWCWANDLYNDVAKLDFEECKNTQMVGSCVYLPKFTVDEDSVSGES